MHTPCRSPRCHPQSPIAAVFFGGAAFFRAARDVSGAHRVPPWARVVIKLKMSFQALSHSPSLERALALTSPPPDFLFISIPQCPQPHHPLLVLPFVHTILNFATNFFEMFTKKQSQHPHQVFPSHWILQNKNRHLFF